MPKFLLINGLVTNFRLPASVNAHDLRAAIKEAMEDGSTIDIAYEMGNNPLQNAVVTLNGAALSAASIVELPDSAVIPQ